MKKEERPKYRAYVVFVGKIPGIYENWNECRANTDGYRGSLFRGYLDYEEAIKALDAFEQDGALPFNAAEPDELERKAAILSGRICPYCDSLTTLADSAEVYNGRSYGMIRICRPCCAWVGCHKGTNKALGRLADAALRRKKQEFHAAFDPIWKSGAMARSGLYKWLADRMGLHQDECHGGMFTIEQCDSAIAMLSGFAKKPIKSGKPRIDPLIGQRARALVASKKSGSITTCRSAQCSYPSCLCGT